MELLSHFQILNYVIFCYYHVFVFFIDFCLQICRYVMINLHCCSSRRFSARFLVVCCCSLLLGNRLIMIVRLRGQGMSFCLTSLCEDLVIRIFSRLFLGGILIFGNLKTKDDHQNTQLSGYLHL